eukprot:7277440-Pyramimonas_sp.AAC.1
MPFPSLCSSVLFGRDEACAAAALGPRRDPRGPCSDKSQRPSETGSASARGPRYLFGQCGPRARTSGDRRSRSANYGGAFCGPNLND